MNLRSTAASLALATLLSATALASADAATSTTHARATSYTVTVTVNKTEPVVGDVVKVKGAVSPAAPGAEVTLQVKYEGRSWKTLDHTRLSQNSKFKFKPEVKTIRERKYRVVKADGQHRAGGKATTEKVTVFGWRDLATVGSPIMDSFIPGGLVTMNAVAYPQSLTATNMKPAAQIDYNINRDCKQLDAVYGMSDASPNGSTVGLSLAADGVLRDSGTYALTQTRHVVTDLTGVFRLTFSSTQTGGGIANVGTPKVLCSF